MGEEKRHEMMETLFGAESEDSDDEPEQSLRPALSDRASDRSLNTGPSSSASRGGTRRIACIPEGRMQWGGARGDKEGSYEEVEGEDGDGDAEVDVEGEAESEGERVESDIQNGASDEEERADSDRESEGGREVEVESEGEREEVEVSASGSERSHRAQPLEDYEDEEMQEEARGQSEGEEDDHEDVEPRERVEVAEARDVFGESDEDEDQDAEHEPEPEAAEHRIPEESLQGSPERVRSDDEGSEGDAARAEEIVGDDDRDHSDRSESDDERHIEQKPEKPMGPPIELQVPLRPPPGMPDQLNIIRMSNIMNIDMKPFDPTTYEAEEPFTTEVEGKKQHIRLEENVVRWRPVHNRDGHTSYESNARFVKWSDGSMQLLLGSEVLDLSVQNATQDQSHLFVRHHKSILQSQGQVLRKMRFMPSSLTSKSHRLLTALVDSKHKKVFKVKTVITETDPEKEKHDREKQVQETIRSKVDLQRKQEKLTSKYTPRPRVTERERELSPGYLEGALEEEDEIDTYDRGSRRYQEELEQEQRAERRILHAKRQAPARPPPSRSMNKGRSAKDDFLDDSMSDDSEREPSVQESDHNDDLVGGAWEEEDDEEEEEERRPSSRGKATEREDRRRGEREEDDRKRKRDREERSPSPAKKPISRRRVVVSDSDDD